MTDDLETATLVRCGKAASRSFLCGIEKHKPSAFAQAADFLTKAMCHRIVFFTLQARKIYAAHKSTSFYATLIG